MSEVKIKPAGIDALTTRPKTWRADKFTTSGFQFVAALQSGRFVHTEIPGLKNPTPDMNATLKSAPAKEVEERVALNKRQQLDTTLPLRSEAAHFLTSLFVSDAIEYTEVLEEMYGEYTTGEGRNAHSHDISLEGDGRLVWKETFPRAASAPNALDWVEFTLIPGDSRVFRKQKTQSQPPQGTVEIIGASDVSNRLCKHMKAILRDQIAL